METQSVTLQDKIRFYHARFGHTFNLVALDLSNANTGAKLARLLDEAIAGSRGKITDADLGIAFPNDALI